MATCLLTFSFTGNDKMMPLKDNQDVATFLVTKHSWKGRYKRVFSVGTHGITTYNPERLEVTNKWQYSDVITLTSAKHSNQPNNYDFTLVMKKDKKNDTMKFSSEHKCLIITEAFKYRHMFAEKPKDIYVSTQNLGDRCLLLETAFLQKTHYSISSLDYPNLNYLAIWLPGTYSSQSK